MQRVNAAPPHLRSRKGRHHLPEPLGWCISSAAANEGTKGALNHLFLVVGLDLLLIRGLKVP